MRTTASVVVPPVGATGTSVFSKQPYDPVQWRGSSATIMFNAKKVMAVSARLRKKAADIVSETNAAVAAALAALQSHHTTSIENLKVRAPDIALKKGRWMGRDGGCSLPSDRMWLQSQTGCSGCWAPPFATCTHLKSTCIYASRRHVLIPADPHTLLDLAPLALCAACRLGCIATPSSPPAGGNHVHRERNRALHG